MFNFNGRLLSDAEAATAQAECEAGTRLKRTTSSGDYLLSVNEESAIRAEWAANSAKPTPILPCSPWQIRKALNQSNLRIQVEDAVAMADQATQDGWEYATEFRRDDPLVISMGMALGKTDAEMDALFALARTL